MAKNYILTYEATLIDVIDGDTADVKIYLGFGLTTVKRIRFAGVDTPEIHNTPHNSAEYLKGFNEKIFVRSWFKDSPDPFILEVLGIGYFGRTVAIIRPNIGAKSLNQELKDRGYSRETFYRNGRPFWNDVANKIDIEYPKGKNSLVDGKTDLINRK